MILQIIIKSLCTIVRDPKYFPPLSPLVKETKAEAHGFSSKHHHIFDMNDWCDKIEEETPKKTSKNVRMFSKLCILGLLFELQKPKLSPPPPGT